MGWYIVKRIGQMIPVFFGATFLIYAMAVSYTHLTLPTNREV